MLRKDEYNRQGQRHIGMGNGAGDVAAIAFAQPPATHLDVEFGRHESLDRLIGGVSRIFRLKRFTVEFSRERTGRTHEKRGVDAHGHERRPQAQEIGSECRIGRQRASRLTDPGNHGDATLSYMRKVILRAHDPNSLQGSLEDYVGDSVGKGWVSIWCAYYDPHKQNLRKVQEAMKNTPLPRLSK